MKQHLCFIASLGIYVPPEQLAALVRQAADLSETQKKVIAKLEDELDLNQRQIRAALGVLGENDIPPERLAAKLVEIAERFKDLQATASAQPGDNPKIAALKTDAQKAIEAGELANADALLADVETEQRQALDRFAINAAETSAQRGESRSLDCVMPKLPNISPTRQPCFHLRALTSSSG
jgi:outer membrane PBP1 activator LpoA protein